MVNKRSNHRKQKRSRPVFDWQCLPLYVYFRFRKRSKRLLFFLC